MLLLALLAIDPALMALLLEGLVILVAVAIVGGFALMKLTPDRASTVLAAADFAYGVIAELARKTENQFDDKAAEGLKKAIELLKLQGRAPPSPEEEKLILARFDALHAEEKRQEVLAGAGPQ